MLFRNNVLMQIYPTHNIIDSPLSIRLQRILFLGFFYTIFAGVVRKWILPFGTISDVLLLGQLLLPIIMAWRYSQIKSLTKSFYTLILVLYFMTLLTMAINPLNHTALHGAVGVVIHLGFWYLLLAYLQISDRVNIIQLDYFLFAILIVETILTTTQYSLPEDHIINRFSAEDSQGVVLGDGIRVTGTFSYFGGFASMVIFYGFFTWSLLNRNQKPILVIITTVISIYLAFMSGGRGNFITVSTLVVVGIYENLGKGIRYLQSFFKIGIFVLIVSVFFNPLRPIIRAWDNFYDRANELTERGESTTRVYRNYFSAFLYHGDQPLFGAGLGSDYQGANAMFGTSDTKLQYGFTEEEGERIVFEGGYLLYFIRIGLFIVVLSALKIKRLSKFVLFILFFNKLIVFNTYMTFFLAMGFIWINQSKLLRSRS